MYADAAFILHQMYLFDTARFSNKSLTKDYVIDSQGRATFAPAKEINIYKCIGHSPNEDTKFP